MAAPSIPDSLRTWPLLVLLVWVDQVEWEPERLLAVLAVLVVLAAVAVAAVAIDHLVAVAVIVGLSFAPASERAFSQRAVEV